VTSTQPAQAGPPSPITRPAQTATEWLTRMIYAAMGPTAVAFGLLSLHTFLVQAAPSAGALPSASWALVFGLPTMIGVLSTWGPLRLMRAMAWAEGGVFLVSLTYWLLFRAVPLPAAQAIARIRRSGPQVESTPIIVGSPKTSTHDADGSAPACGAAWTRNVFRDSRPNATAVGPIAA
jgi:hypothetical protein